MKKFETQLKQQMLKQRAERLERQLNKGSIDKAFGDLFLQGLHSKARLNITEARI